MNEKCEIGVLRGNGYGSYDFCEEPAVAYAKGTDGKFWLMCEEHFKRFHGQPEEK